MSRGNFPPGLFGSILRGEASLRVSGEQLEGPVTVMTSRISECPPDMLNELHTVEPCNNCHQPCIIHPETPRMAPDRLVLCWPCAAEIGYKPKEVVMHPESAAETKFPKGRQ